MLRWRRVARAMPGAAFSVSLEAHTHWERKPETPSAQAWTEYTSGLQPCCFLFFFSSLNHRLSLYRLGFGFSSTSGLLSCKCASSLARSLARSGIQHPVSPFPQTVSPAP